MAIKVSVFGAEKESDEYAAALKLKNIIQFLYYIIFSGYLFINYT